MLNRKAQQSGFNMHLLFALLGHEVSMVTVNVKLMSDNKVRRTRHKNSVSTDAGLQQYWAEYQAGIRFVSRLLNACARMFASRHTSQFSVIFYSIWFILLLPDVGF